MISAQSTCPRVLVVGASSGIGRSLARHAVTLGSRVCVAARRIGRLVEIDGAYAIACDLSDPDDCRRVVERAVTQLDQIDMLIHAAGVGAMERIEDVDAESWRRIYEVNVLGPTLVTAAALPYLSRDALVAFMSSEAASETRWGMSAYASSKAALDATIRYWRLEHPERRFMRIVMGATTGTEFGDDFGSEALDVAFERWAATGIRFELMEVDAVGRQLAEMLSVALSHPSVDVPDLVLDPRGAPWPAMTNTAGEEQV